MVLGYLPMKLWVLMTFAYRIQKRHTLMCWNPVSNHNHFRNFDLIIISMLNISSEIISFIYLTVHPQMHTLSWTGNGGFEGKKRRKGWASNLDSNTLYKARAVHTSTDTIGWMVIKRAVKRDTILVMIPTQVIEFLLRNTTIIHHLLKGVSIFNPLILILPCCCPVFVLGICSKRNI